MYGSGQPYIFEILGVIADGRKLPKTAKNGKLCYRII